MSRAKSDFLAGARDVSLAIPGPFTVAVVASVAALGAGLTVAQAYVMIGVTFAGASQLAALELLTDGAALAVVVATALVINARFAIFSASLAPHFRGASAAWRWLMGFVLSTPASVVALAEFATDEETNARAYYLGAALTMWLTWQAGTVFGLVVGARMPSDVGLTFVVPLVFIGMLFSTIRDGPTAVAALVGALVAVAGVGLPLDVGFIVGTAAGVAAGQVVDWRAEP